MKRKKLKSIKTLEHKLDRIFSEYIRRKDAAFDGVVFCVTCGIPMNWKTSNCGHFIKRQHRIVRWSEENCHVQCVRCNHYLGGNDAVYAGFIIEKYGKEIYDYLISCRAKTFKVTRSFLEEKISEFSQKLKEKE